jgi:hypothetical protein
LLLVATPAAAQIVLAEPLTAIEAPFPDGAPAVETQVVLAVVVDSEGNVESAVESARTPPSAPDVFVAAAVKAVRAAKFTPSTRDGKPIRSRVEYVVVFHPPDTPAPATSNKPTPEANEQDEDYTEVVVHGTGWASPRGASDVRVRRDQLEASPRAQTSELLSAAPGFFVDHEDGEGFGNDVYLRGFNLEHGSGIEMRLGSIPINIPIHVQGQGYADANFIIPEVVRSVRVLQGPYDPRQGDAAIVGSAYFDLGVVQRGYQLKTSYGSFNQARVVAIAAPTETDEESFLAFSLRTTDGFGMNRAAQSGAAIAQYGLDLGPRDRLKMLATAYGSRANLPGVVRKDDVDAGRIGLDDSYPFFAQNQGVQTSRVLVGADFDHFAPGGARFEFAPWVMLTSFRARQNFTGDMETSHINPAVSGIGDLFQTTNSENAAGLTSRVHSAPWRLGDAAEIVAEPGVYLRAGRTTQTKGLLDPSNLVPWDRRTDFRLSTLDAGGYVDMDARLFKRLRLSGGIRADALAVSIEDRLANFTPTGTGQVLAGAQRDAVGIAVGPRATLEYQLSPEIAPSISYGEGFRSLDAGHLPDGATQPFSRVRSAEAGMRAQLLGDRFTSTLAAFETRIGNEIVFEATSGGLTTQRASTRRGVVGSVVARPLEALLASASLSVTSATFLTDVPGVAHYVPNVPPVVFHTDLSARGVLTKVRTRALGGRLGVGYTFLSERHLTDAIMGPANHVLNAGASLRYDWLEIGLDAYNLIGTRYADDAQVYVSNWSLRPGQQPASMATHYTAAPPRSLLGTLSLIF